MYKNLFPWYFLVDDDTFIFTENLNKFTALENPNEPLYYGFKWNYMIAQGYIGGGAGMLFTNESMNRLVKNYENGVCTKFIDGYGDITIGRCAEIVQIKIGNSYDQMKRPRFHPHDHKTHFLVHCLNHYTRLGHIMVK